MKMDRTKSLLPLLGISMIIAFPGSHTAAIDWNSIGFWALDWLRAFVTFFVLGLLAIWIIPKPLHRWSEVVRQSPLKSFGAGILVVIVGYAGALLLFALTLAFGIFLIVITLGDLGGVVLTIGLPAVGLFFTVLNFIIAFVSKLVVIFFLGKILLERLSPKALKHNIWPLLLGLVIYLLVRAIPWLGWAVGVIVTLVGLGAIWLDLSHPKAVVENSPAVEEQAAEEPQPDDLETIPVVEGLDTEYQPGEANAEAEVDSQVGD